MYIRFDGLHALNYNYSARTEFFLNEIFVFTFCDTIFFSASALSKRARYALQIEKARETMDLADALIERINDSDMFQRKFKKDDYGTGFDMNELSARKKWLVEGHWRRYSDFHTWFRMYKAFQQFKLATAKSSI